MKNTSILLFSSLLIFLSTTLFAQEKAVTERGDTVVLYANGTWDYYDDYLFGDTEEFIPVDSSLYVTPKSSKKSAKGKNDFYEVMYNDKLWKRIPSASINEDADITFQMRDEDAYAMIIYEEMEIELESLVDIALSTAIEAAFDSRVVVKEYRTVNGNKVIHMEIKGMVSGIKFVYNSHYFTSENGAIQFITFTSSNLYERLKGDMDDLLNGLVILN